MCTLVLQAAHREVYSREDAESQLREEKTGQTQGEVSTNKSAGIIEDQVHIIILSSCWWKWLQQLVFVRTWSETILYNKLCVCSAFINYTT